MRYSKIKKIQNKAILEKKQKSEKRTHFAVIKSNETTYKELFAPFWT